MTDIVKITIDDIEYEVPAGMNLVDAAKRCGVDIPVFCYHPKLGHDGNCRMCLVELATPRQNRDTGQMELAWLPTLQTACTQRTSEGLAIRTRSPKVIDGRREILEFLLSSHPLDCPICDKGGECPLQNLTMRHGPGTSRMYWEEKMHLGKHIPLGELIFLDQERCIHCARCIRFQDLIADDPVLGFDQRGRRQQIITHSHPPFDSIFSGNTTDICPVGALTTADFRFNARPWEMVQVATICSHCPVGCNMSFDTRPDRLAGGRTTIKRVMPRQNERVNEIWICDKGRFAYPYMDHSDRLRHPMARRGGQLVEATWDEAINEAVAQLKAAGPSVAAIAGGRLSNEDLYVLQKLIRTQGSHCLAPYPDTAPGGQFAAWYGVGVGTNLLDMGAGDAILVIACDLHQEAPVWWLRVIAAAKRGAQVIVINGRETRLDKFATHAVRYAYGDEIATLNALLGSLPKSAIQPGRVVEGLEEALAYARECKASADVRAAAKSLTEARHAIAFVGSEGLGPLDSDQLAQAAANLLVATGHTGRPNNGLVIVWPTANGQGASDMGFRPDCLPGYWPLETPGMGYADILSALESNQIKALYIAGADPAFDDPAAERALRQTKGFIIVQDMFLTNTAKLADIVLPACSIGEREGTYTTGERRVQRFYPAIEPIGQSRPDWQIVQTIAAGLGHGQPAPSAAALLTEIGQAIPQYAGITYQALAQIEPQFPDVGGEDLYYGGTAFTNVRGLGVQWATLAEDSNAALTVRPARVGTSLSAASENDTWVVVPITLIYDAEPVFGKTSLLHRRVPAPYVGLNPADAARLNVSNGEMLAVMLGDHRVAVAAYVDAQTPAGVLTMPRRLQPQGAPRMATLAHVAKLEKMEA